MRDNSIDASDHGGKHKLHKMQINIYISDIVIIYSSTHEQ